MAQANEVAGHYTSGSLIERIEGGLAAAGLRPPLSPDDLAPLDEFHIGGRDATVPFMAALGLAPGARALDLGCGLGGPARYAAAVHGAQVTGIDLTPEFVAAGSRLTGMTGQSDKVALVEGSILDLPLEDDSFDVAWMIHVGMNIADKAGIAREAARVLRSGGTFGLYEVMRLSDLHPDFPVPWASAPDQSALDRPDAYRDALTGAGFEIVAETDRTSFAQAFFARLAAAQAGASGPPPLGLHLVMGDTTAVKVRHMTEAIADGRIAAIEMIARLPG